MNNRFFYRTILILFACLSFTFMVNYVVDPFNINDLFNLGLHKDKISCIMNYRLYKLIEFKNHPQKNIILGDSRGDSLKVTYLKEIGANNFANLSYGGGTLYEAVDTFWYCVKSSRLNLVIIVVPFNLYSETNNYNIVGQAEHIIENPIKYYVNSFILEASFSNLYTRLTGRMWKTEKPDLDKEAFWQMQLGETVTGEFYRDWKYPQVLYNRLKQIIEYCHFHNIKLIFLIPPTHIELQNKIVEYGLTEEYQRYKEDLAKIALVADFDYPNKVTADKECFLDPYHFNPKIARLIAKKLVDLSYLKVDKGLIKMIF
jgi:hypothetical protein